MSAMVTPPDAGGRGGPGRHTIFRHAIFVLRSNPVTAIAAIGIAVVAIAALLAPWIAPYDPIASDVPHALQAPSAAHWAGTDQLGRDILSRILLAARLDLLIAVCAVSLSFVVGAAVGGFCG
jgi:peptide/nickel transport system permease protein